MRKVAQARQRGQMRGGAERPSKQVSRSLAHMHMPTTMFTLALLLSLQVDDYRSSTTGNPC